MNEYVARVSENLTKLYSHEPEYLQCVQNWLEMIEPAVGKSAVSSEARIAEA